MPALKTGILVPVSGLDVSKDAEFIDSRATPNCQNISIERLTLRKRPGTTELGASLGERVVCLVELKIGSNTYFLRMGPSKVQLLNKIAKTWSSVANAPLTASDVDRICYAFPYLSGQKVMVFTNGIDAIRKYTGTGDDAALGGTPPLARYLVSFGSYLVLGHITDGGDTFPSRLQWCDTGNIEEWVNGNAGYAELVEDPSDITSVSLFGDNVCVHKPEAIYLGYLVSTSAIFRFDRKNTGVGTVCHYTVQNLPTGEQIFLATDGFHLFNGVNAPLIQSPMMEEIREQMNPQYVSKCWSAIKVEKDEYWCGVPLGNQTEPETVYKYNYRTGQIHKDVRPGITAVGKFENSTQRTWDDNSLPWDQETTRWNDIANLALNPVIALGDSAGATTREDSSNSDNGTAIDAFWDSANFTARTLFNNPQLAEDQLIRCLALQIWAKGAGTLTVQYSTDDGQTWLNASQITLAQEYPTDAAPLYSYFDVVTSKIMFRFRNNTAGETFFLKKFKIESLPWGTVA